MFEIYWFKSPKNSGHRNEENTEKILSSFSVEFWTTI